MCRDKADPRPLVCVPGGGSVASVAAWRGPRDGGWWWLGDGTVGIGEVRSASWVKGRVISATRSRN